MHDFCLQNTEFLLVCREKKKKKSYRVQLHNCDYRVEKASLRTSVKRHRGHKQNRQNHPQIEQVKHLVSK